MRRNPEKHLDYFAVIDSCATTQCPLCSHVTQRMERYLESLLYEHVNDVGFRRRLSSAGGFCNEHAYRLLAEGDALGTAILFHVTLAQSAPRVFRTRRRSTRRSRRCPVCDYLVEIECRYIDTLLSFAEDRDLQAAFRRSSGLCVPHLERLFGATPDVPDWLTSFHRHSYAELLSQSRRFIASRNATGGVVYDGDPSIWRHLVTVLCGYHGMRPADGVQRRRG